MFCNSALEAFIQAEFSAIKAKTCRVLNELERESCSVVYNTPAQQSGYVKTLETVLSRSKTLPADSMKQTDLSATSSSLPGTYD